MNFQQVQEFLSNFNIVATNTDYIFISERKFLRLISTATKWYGTMFGVFLSECFLDTTDNHYLFLPTSWEELQQVFNSSPVAMLTYTRHPTTTFQKSR